MKMYRIFLFLLVVHSLHAAPRWLQDLREAKQIALQQQKPLFVDFYSEGCHYCKVIEKEIYSSKEFWKYLDKFVFVMIDGDADIENLENFKVEGFPTIIVLDPYLYELGRIEGYLPKQQFLKKLDELYSRKDYYKLLEARLEKEPANFRLLYEMGVYYYRIQNYEKAMEYLTASLQKLSSSEPSYYQDRKNLLYNMAVLYSRMEKYEKAYSFWNGYLAWLKKEDPDYPFAKYYVLMSYLYKMCPGKLQEYEKFRCLREEDQKSFLGELRSVITVLPDSREKEKARKILSEIQF